MDAAVVGVEINNDCWETVFRLLPDRSRVKLTSVWKDFKEISDRIGFASLFTDDVFSTLERCRKDEVGARYDLERLQRFYHFAQARSPENAKEIQDLGLDAEKLSQLQSQFNTESVRIGLGLALPGMCPRNQPQCFFPWPSQGITVSCSEANSISGADFAQAPLPIFHGHSPDGSFYLGIKASLHFHFKDPTEPQIFESTVILIRQLEPGGRDVGFFRDQDSMLSRLLVPKTDGNVALTTNCDVKHTKKNWAALSLELLQRGSSTLHFNACNWSDPPDYRFCGGKMAIRVEACTLAAKENFDRRGFPWADWVSRNYSDIEPWSGGRGSDS